MKMPQCRPKHQKEYDEEYNAYTFVHALYAP